MLTRKSAKKISVAFWSKVENRKAFPLVFKNYMISPRTSVQDKNTVRAAMLYNWDANENMR